MTLRIAMWSGPRNVSTALMRSFEARGDCMVVDEPLYAAYLQRTGLEHPGRDEILASQPTDPEEALAKLANPTHGFPLQFEKHMAQHWFSDWDWAWLGDAHHVFLIRDPSRVLASYAKVREPDGPEELGTLQQGALLDAAVQAGQPPIVVDGDELRAAPARLLEALCERLGIPFRPSMLEWPPGPRPTDGVWAQHWYRNVKGSSGFSPPEGTRQPCPPELAHLAATLRPVYEQLAFLRIR